MYRGCRDALRQAWLHEDDSGDGAVIGEAAAGGLPYVLLIRSLRLSDRTSSCSLPRSIDQGHRTPASSYTASMEPQKPRLSSSIPAPGPKGWSTQ